MRIAMTFVLMVSGGAVAAAEPVAPTFTRKPTAVRDGEQVRITFAVSAPTDVEVAVVDAGGKVVRHLAAGVLGGLKPPPEPLTPGLAQQLVWDGKDDFGAPAGQGPFRVRVRAGLDLKVGALLAEDPLYVCYPESMATDDDGNLYFLSSSSTGLDFHHLRVFNRRGEYLRTVMPMPADLPLDQARAFNVIETGGGRWAPRNRCGTWPEFYRQESLAVGVAWELANRVGRDGVLNLCNNGSLLRLNLTGGPAGPGAQPVPLFPKRQVKPYAPVAGTFYLAASPDGARLYLSGLGSWREKRTDPDFPAGRILVRERGETRTFVDVTLGDRQGKQEWIPRVNYADLAGMSCDARGNLYVCDPTNGKVRVFEPSGKETGGFDVEAPLQVACHRKTGALYVLCVSPQYAQGRKVLRKFSALAEGAREVCAFALPTTGESGCMALDDSAEPPVIWAATRAGHVQYTFNAPARVFRLEDRGPTFVETPHPILFGLDGVKDRLAVHPETELVVYKGQYADAGAVNGLTGEKVALPFKHCIDMAAGQDGHWYVQVTSSFAGYVLKYDRDLKPAAVQSKMPPPGAKGKTPENAVGWAFGKYGWGISAAGLAADRAGRLFTLQLGNTHVDGGYFVVVFGPDGKVEEHPWAKDHPKFGVQVKDQGFQFFNSALVSLLDPKDDWHYGNQGAGLQVDPQGNVYVGTRLSPVGYSVRAGYEQDVAYTTCVGAVIKFPPGGGQLINLAGQPPEGRPGLVLERRCWPKGRVFAENALTVYRELGSVGGGVGTGCSCRQPTFSVDPYGRLAIPNAITFSVRFVDNVGNEIAEVGKYGNLDVFVPALTAVQETLPKEHPLRRAAVNAAKSETVNALLEAAPGGGLPAAAAAFGWPEAVAAGERALYVADVYNHRIVRLDKTYGAEALSDIK
jgi:hypothetical protein